MKHREKDVSWCGVSKEKIISAKPTLNEEAGRLYAHMISERYKIRVKKDVEKLPRSEWTTDPIFQSYKFTNVRREHDRESLWLIRNISENPELSLEDKIYNTILFRAFNKSSTLEIFGAPFKGFVDIKQALDIAESYPDPKYVWYTSAFNMGGIKTVMGKMMDKDTLEHPHSMKIRPLYMYNIIRTDNVIHEQILNASSQLEVFNIITSIPGFAKFMAYQVFVDFTYIPEFPFSENEFTISGPGCSRGISVLFDDMDGMNDEEAIFWIRDNFENWCRERDIEFDVKSLFSDLPEHDRCLNVMSIENCFCEFSKYHRAYSGTGRPRVKYKPSETNLDGTTFEGETVKIFE